jgi:pyruvate ferredoxin oxidoreductase gamma subunit
MPVLDPEKCTHCGMCDLVCPDLCLVWGAARDSGPFERKLKGVDYRYCKGCMRCVESCPSGALTRRAEAPGRADQLRVAKFPELVG